VRDFDGRREEIKQQLITAATEIGFLCVHIFRLSARD
jgi:hypothetical protein